ncbi:TPA: hypothetical protein ACF33T_004435 [Vibrio parahaemolyticus]
MLKKTIVGLALVAGLVGCSDPEIEWLYNGSSVGLDRQGWLESSADRRLGTAGFWLRGLNKDGWLKDPAMIEGESFKKNAQQLAECVDSSIAVSQAETNHLVASCVSVMGWSSDKRS